MGKFGNIQAYDFQKAIASRMEDKYNYYCEFPKSYEEVVVKVYSSWVAKYEKDQSISERLSSAAACLINGICRRGSAYTHEGLRLLCS